MWSRLRRLPILWRLALAPAALVVLLLAGLGLAIARWVIEEHGGVIRCMRAAGRDGRSSNRPGLPGGFQP